MIEEVEISMEKRRIVCACQMHLSENTKKSDNRREAFLKKNRVARWKLNLGQSTLRKYAKNGGSTAGHGCIQSSGII
jgi:hypothetical protein